jgi:RIP metalloprotease RseP
MSIEPSPTNEAGRSVATSSVDAGPPTAPTGTSASRAFRLAALIGLVVLLGVTQGMSMVIVVLSIVLMIFLHELGHYVMARRAGMLVTEFFIGFGPRIWSFHRGETEYGIKAIPAGAYVKIVGMSNMEEVEPELEPRTYRQGRFHERLGVAVAGSAMHFIIALVLLVSQFALIGAPVADRWLVGDVTPGSAAEVGGIEPGDEVVAFDGQPVPDFTEFRDLIAGAEPGTVELQVVRDGEQRAVPIQLSSRMKIIGTIREDVDVVDNGERLFVGEPRNGGVAAGTGLEGGSTLLAVNGQPVETLDDVRAAAQSSVGGRFTLSVAGTDGAVSRHEIDLGSDVATTEPASFVGVGQRPVLATESLPAAMVSSVETFAQAVRLSVEGIGRFLWPPNLFGFIIDAVGGAPEDPATTPTPAESTPSTVSETRPISIIGVAILGSDLSAQDFSNLILFLATLNIFIGVFNLFPLLPFDGGHVVIAIYEKVQEMRRRTRERYFADISRMIPFAYGAVIVLAVVGLLAIFVDLTRGVSF